MVPIDKVHRSTSFRVRVPVCDSGKVGFSFLFEKLNAKVDIIECVVFNFPFLSFLKNDSTSWIYEHILVMWLTLMLCVTLPPPML